MGAAGGPGAVVMVGSGETGAVGREALAWLRASGRAPHRVAVLETPAGFEPNAEAVAARWAEFLQRQSEMEDAEFVQLALRGRGMPSSPDDPDLARPLLAADVIVLGAGSPTYVTRQLRDSVAWRYAQGAHLLGASFLLASASAIAAGTCALPVYEIYKVGEDLHWKDGLRLLDLYGLLLAVVTHWDNTDGGAELDTSRAYMGAARFADLLALIPAGVAVVGIAEHTALALDPADATGHVLGRGSVTLLRDGASTSFDSGTRFPLDALGPFAVPDVGAIVPVELRRAIQAARAEREPSPPADVAALVASRERARAALDFATADRLRDEIGDRGWRVDDTPSGPRLALLKRP